jgi:hypothetical protein
LASALAVLLYSVLQGDGSVSSLPPQREEREFRAQLDRMNEVVDLIMSGLDGMAGVMSESKESQDRLYGAFNKVSTVVVIITIPWCDGLVVVCVVGAFHGPRHGPLFRSGSSEPQGRLERAPEDVSVGSEVGLESWL